VLTPHRTAYGGGDGATEAEEALLARACLSQFLIV